MYPDLKAVLGQADALLGLPWWLWLLVGAVVLGVLVVRRRPRGGGSGAGVAPPRLPFDVPAPDQFGPTPVPVPPAGFPAPSVPEAEADLLERRGSCEEGDERWVAQDQARSFPVAAPDAAVTLSLGVLAGGERADLPFPGSDEHGTMSQETLLSFDEARLVDMVRALRELFSAQGSAPLVISVGFQVEGEVVEATCLRLLRCDQGRWVDAGRRECRRLARPDPVVEAFPSGGALEDDLVLERLRRALESAREVVRRRRVAWEELDAYCASCG